MSQFPLFLIEVAICLVSSALLAVAITRPLRSLLADACESVERATFWVAYCDAMIFIAPLVASALFGKAGEVFAPSVVFYKAALGSALAGVFVALAAIGLQVAKTLPPRPPPAAGSGPSVAVDAS